MTETQPQGGASPFRPGSEFLKILLLLLISGGIGLLAAKNLLLGMVPGAVVGLSVFGVSLFAVTKLRGAPAGLWLTFSLKFFSVTAYKLVTVVLVSYLMKDCGVKDSTAQYIFGIWGMFMSISTLLSGSLTDALGLRRTLLIGITLCLATRLVMFVSSSAWVVLVCGLIPLALGEALCTPVLVAATRIYSTAAQRSIAFSVFYSILNLGFMFAYFIRDGVQTGALVGGGTFSLVGMELSPQRALLLVSFGIELLALPFILLMRDKAVLAARTVSVSWLASVGAAARETGRLFAALVQHPAFRRLLVFLLMIGLLKIVFNIMDAVLPTFAEREIGAAGARCVGRLNAVNSILILILAPLVGIMTRKLPAYPMVIFGGFITAASFVFMVLPAANFQWLAESSSGQWFGHAYLKLDGAVHPYLIMILLWQIAFSIGEAFYSPRVYEYAVSIAPEGQEASYASLSAVPLLMGKFINSVAFAGLLTQYCPAVGPRDPGRMWLIIGLLVLVAPVGLFVFQRFIRVKEEGRDA